MSYGTKLQKKIYYSLPSAIQSMIASAYGFREKSKRTGGAFHRYFEEARNSQRFSRAELNGLCFERLRNFVMFAQHNSQFYARLFRDIGFDAGRMTSFDGLAKIPVLQKEVMRTNLKNIVPKDSSRWDVHTVHTSGTTGFGLEFPETIDCFRREYAYRFQNYEEGGARIGERWAFCAGHPVAAPEQLTPPYWVRDYANNWLLMSSAHLTEKSIPLYIDQLARFSPVLLGGYPSSVYLLALANQHLGSPVRPKAIYTASETLLAFQRDAIASSFGCRPRSYYGNAERCGFFSECEYGVFHVREEHSYVEVLRVDGTWAGPGEEGAVVVTGYGNRATPLIRYAIGDVARVASNQTCRCGRGGLLLDEIIGRVEDYVVTPDGKFLGRLDHLFKGSNQVRMAQLYQDKADMLEIRIVRAPGYAERDEAAILEEARLRLGKAINIRFRYVQDIERTRTGKFRFVLSKIGTKAFLGRALE